MKAGAGMKKETLSNIIFSPFEDNEENKQIKEYAKKIKNLPDFKNLNLCIVQYNDTPTFNKKLKLVNFYNQQIKKVTSIANSICFGGGLYHYLKKEILIFIDNQIRFGRIKSIKISLSQKKLEVEHEKEYVKKTCCSILKTMYHEKRHYLQHETKNNSFESIMQQIEIDLKTSVYGIFKYLTKHDSWYIEIDANNYGVNMALDYYKNNPQDDNVDLNYLEYLQKKYLRDDLLYDFDSFFTMYNICLEKLPIRHYLLNKYFKDTKEMTWYKVLYGNENKLKFVEDILNNPLVNDIDPKFINLVLTSKYLNKDTDYANLEYKTLVKLHEAFQIRLETICSNIDKISNIDIKIKTNDLNRVKEDIIWCNKILIELQEQINNNKSKIKYKQK